MSSIHVGMTSMKDIVLLLISCLLRVSISGTGWQGIVMVPY